MMVEQPFRPQQGTIDIHSFRRWPGVGGKRVSERWATVVDKYQPLVTKAICNGG